MRKPCASIELKQVWEKYYSKTEEFSNCRISHYNTHFHFKTEHDLKKCVSRPHYMLHFQLEWCILCLMTLYHNYIWEVKQRWFLLLKWYCTRRLHCFQRLKMPFNSQYHAQNLSRGMKLQPNHPMQIFPGSKVDLLKDSTQIFCQ